MLKEHLDMCRDEDDSSNILELNNMAIYDSEEEEENEDDPLASLDDEGM